jgi:hypothetical protein
MRALDHCNSEADKFLADDKSSPVNKSKPDCPAVRFASTHQEIEPGSVDNSKLKLSEGAEAKLRALSSTLNDTTLKPVDTKVQEQRMGRYTFEPVSLPVSRVREKLRFMSPNLLCKNAIPDVGGY